MCQLLLNQLLCKFWYTILCICKSQLWSFKFIYFLFFRICDFPFLTEIILDSFSKCSWTIIYLWTFYNINSPKSQLTIFWDDCPISAWFFILFKSGDYFWLQTMNDRGLSMMIGHKLPLLKHHTFLKCTKIGFSVCFIYHFMYLQNGKHG